MKKAIPIIICTIMILTTNSCSWINKQTTKNPPSNKNMICEQLKQELLFASQNSANLNNNSNSYIRENQLLTQYI